MNSSRSSSRAARTAHAPCAGFTLIELLLVMAILSLVLGLGLGMFAALDLGERAALGLVKNNLRAAQNTSIAQRAPTELRMDLASGSMQLRSSRVLGTWQFEGGSLEGAFGRNGNSTGAELRPGGFMGQALFLDAGARGAHADFDLGADPLVFEQGFGLQCALRCDELRAGNLLSLGAAAGLQLTDAGALRAWFVPLVQAADGSETSGGFITLQTAAGALLPGRWHLVEMRYDQSEFSLSVDDRVLARIDEVAKVWPLVGPLVISDVRTGFAGAIDNLSVWNLSAAQAVALPKGVVFAPESPRLVRFAAGGGLDRAYHREPLRVVLEYEDGTRRAVEVGLYGTVQG